MPRYRLIAGLGNPGREYERTRHNIGFLVLDRLREIFGAAIGEWQSKGQALIADLGNGDERVWLVKPQSFMNLSGAPIAELMRFYKLSMNQLIVVHDDIDLPFGAVRIREDGGDGGHNGIKSIASCLGSADFVRIKLGVGRPHPAEQREVADWVLSRFSAAEEGTLPEILMHAVEAIRELQQSGVKIAQNKCARRGV